jgi:small nuclear ribonucleoprotein (snRNP)-like protein
MKDFRRAAKRLLERQVVVDTTNVSYEGRLRAVERDFIIIVAIQDDNTCLDQILIRIDEIVALSTI